MNLVWQRTRRQLSSRIAGPAILCAAAGLLTAGCEMSGFARSGDQFGRTYYIDGAGNWGFGVAEVKAGLQRAGYRGEVINFRWSPTFNPALDQTVGRPIARMKGQALGKEITRYLRKYPDIDVNLIALSAGTGVAVWACESLTPPAKVNNVILLGSSLSSDYDMRKALANIEGTVYVYHSRADMILQGPVRTLGTIDGKVGVDAAGIVGLRPRGGQSGKIVNIPWSPKYERYGWTGSHTDATSLPFVRYELAKHIVTGRRDQNSRFSMWTDAAYAVRGTRSEGRETDRARAFADAARRRASQTRPAGREATSPAGAAARPASGESGPTASSARNAAPPSVAATHQASSVWTDPHFASRWRAPDAH